MAPGPQEESRKTPTQQPKIQLHPQLLRRPKNATDSSRAQSARTELYIKWGSTRGLQYIAAIPCDLSGEVAGSAIYLWLAVYCGLKCRVNIHILAASCLRCLTVAK